MLYILRLSNGNCVILLAASEPGARAAARKLASDKASEVVAVRLLDTFGVELSPTEDASLEVERWDDSALDNILANEYSQLHDAYRRANAEPFLPIFDPNKPVISQLKASHEVNTEIIRQGLRAEREKFQRAEVAQKPDAGPMSNGHRKQPAHIK